MQIMECAENEKGANPMNVHHENAQESARSESETALKEITPLNFEIKNPSAAELATTLEAVQPAEQSCGLCKILIGSG